MAENASFEIDLYENTYYPILIAYDKEGKVFGQCHISWKHPYTPLQVVPKEQLYSYNPHHLSNDLDRKYLFAFPNPSTKVVTVRTSSNGFVDQPFTASLFSTDGSLIETWNDQFIGNQFSFRVEDLRSGHYKLTFRTATGETHTFEFFKN